MPAEEERVVTAGIVTAELAARRAGAGAPTFVIGAAGLQGGGGGAGLELLDGEAGREADAVLVSGHRGFDYEELLTATLALQSGATLFATSRDPTLPMPGGAWPGTGAVLAAVETASGASAEIGGKPERHLFELARERIAGAERVAMVGDRIASDIEGGRRAGLATVLVLSGASSREEAEAADPAPDHVIDDLGRPAAMSRRAGRVPTRRPSRASSPSPSAGCSRSAPCCPSCPATSTGRSTAATSRSASWSAPTP